MATPLEKKLRIKDGQKVSLINIPDFYENLFTSFPEIQLRTRGTVELIHFFTKSKKELLLKPPKSKKESFRME